MSVEIIWGDIPSSRCCGIRAYQAWHMAANCSSLSSVSAFESASANGATDGLSTLIRESDGVWGGMRGVKPGTLPGVLISAGEATAASAADCPPCHDTNLVKSVTPLRATLLKDKKFGSMPCQSRNFLMELRPIFDEVKLRIDQRLLYRPQPELLSHSYCSRNAEACTVWRRHCYTTHKAFRQMPLDTFSVLRKICQTYSKQSHRSRFWGVKTQRI